MTLAKILLFALAVPIVAWLAALAMDRFAAWESSRLPGAKGLDERFIYFYLIVVSAGYARLEWNQGHLYWSGVLSAVSAGAFCVAVHVWWRRWRRRKSASMSIG